MTLVEGASKNNTLNDTEIARKKKNQYFFTVVPAEKHMSMISEDKNYSSSFMATHFSIPKFGLSDMICD